MYKRQVVDVGADAVLLGLALVVIVVVMVVMMLVFGVFRMFGVFGIVVVMDVGAALHLLNPCGRSSCGVEVEEVRVEDAVEIHVAVVAFDNLGLGLEGAHDLARASQFLG